MYTVTNSVLTVLPMGQGACNLIEIYGRDSNNTSDPEKLIYLGMVDCGSDDSKENININESFAYLWNKMYERGKVRGEDNPLIDIVLLTHRDSDHHDKFMPLETYLQNNVISYDSTKGRGKTAKKKTYTRSVKKGFQSYKAYSKGDEEARMYSLHKIGMQMLAEFYKEDSPKNIKRRYILNRNNNQIKLSKYKECYKVQINDDPGEKIDSVDIDLVLEGLKDKLNNNATFKQAQKDAVITEFRETMKSDINYNSIDDEIGKHPLAPPIVDLCYYSGEKDSLDGVELFTQAAKNAQYLPVAKISTINVPDTNAKIEILCSLSKYDKKISKAGNSKENLASAVSLWNTEKGKYILAGDATVHTMEHLNNVNIYKNDYENANVMTAPHHGADLTSRGFIKKSGKAKPENMWKIYSGFLSNYKPQGVAISAGYDNKHGHPGRNFLDVTYCYFKNNNKVSETEHSIYANLDRTVKNKEKNYGLYKTKAPIYSILQKNDAGNLCFRALQYSNSSHTPVDGGWSNQCFDITSSIVEDDSSTTGCTNIKTKQSPFDYRKNNKNSCKSPAAAVDLPRAVKRGRAS
ncbi:MAG: hypothetical protein ACLVML_07055 [Candidatus Gastranaerophilaceae bacterium]|nr:hypothetical protein [Christensenellales bacterium]